MAKIMKYHKQSVGLVFKHNNRTVGEEHTNDHIDDRRTPYNYYLKRGSVDDYESRLNELFVIPRKDLVCLCEAIVTLPKDVKAEDERDFFGFVYDFFAADFGEENIVNAVVHKDEDTPHIHINFLPVMKEVYDNSKQSMMLKKYREKHGLSDEDPIERICANERLDRIYFKQLHIRLSQHISDSLGYDVEILNGATDGGDKTVAKLKAESLKNECRELEEKKNALNADLKLMAELKEKRNLPDNPELIPMMLELEYRKKKEDILLNIIEKSGLQIDKEDIFALRDLKKPSYANNRVYVFPEKLNIKTLTEDALIIVPADDTDADYYALFDLRRTKDDLLRRKEEYIIKNGSIKKNQTYCVYKADTDIQSITNLYNIMRDILEPESGNPLTVRNDGTKRTVFVQMPTKETYLYTENLIKNMNCPGRIYMGGEETDVVQERSYER